MIEVRKIKTKEEYQYVSKMAQKNGHGVPYPSHALYNKQGDVVGAWSLANAPIVFIWSHTEKMNKMDSIYHNETLDAIMDEKGINKFLIACDKDSPYYKHMEKFGYESLNWETSMFIKSLK